MKRKQVLILTLFITLFLLIVLTGREGKAALMGGHKRSVVKYDVPDIAMINQDGKQVRLHDYLKSDKPLILAFSYTTCTTFGAVQSANFSNFQRRLQDEIKNIQLLTISLDPEYDTPKLMKEYLKRYYAQEGWDFVKAQKQDTWHITGVFKACEDSTDKMTHYALILLKAPQSDQWVRIDGLIGTATLIEEYRKLSREK